MDYSMLEGLLGGPTPEEKKQLAADAMLNFGLLTLANNTNKRNGMQAIAQGGLGAMQGYRQGQQDLMGKKLQNFKLQQMLEEVKAKQAEKQKLDAFMAQVPSFTQSPQSQALANGQGPTPENAAMIPTLQPKFDREGMYGAMMKSGVPSLVNSGLSGYASLDDKREAAENRRAEFEARIQAQKEAAAAAQQQRMDMFRMQDQSRRDMFAAQQAGREDLARLGASLRPTNEGTKPAKLPAAALKMQQEEKDAIDTASNINGQLSNFVQLLDDGKLNLGPLSNQTAKIKNFLGASDESSQNYASFQATLEKIRNDSLRLNKGVQTEGDAQRAWNELLTNINDPALVRKRLVEIQSLNEKAINLRKMNIDMIRSNYGVDPLEWNQAGPSGDLAAAAAAELARRRK